MLNVLVATKFSSNFAGLGALVQNSNGKILATVVNSRAFDEDLK